jgi:hypothetical protein
MSWRITASGPASLGLLDQYGGAAAAYSLRNLSIYNTSPVVRVRRSSDSTEADFTAAQISDGSLASWVGAGNNGFVRTWYDQTGNNRNATQSSASIQPTIVSSGSLVTHSGKPAVSFTGGLVRLETSSLLQARINSYIVKNTSDTEYVLFGGNNSAAFSWASLSASPSTALTGANYNGSLYANNTIFTGTTRGDIYTFLDGYKLEVHENARTIEWSAFDIGSYNRVEAFNFIGLIQEIVIYSSDQSANRTGIQSSINGHYAIY